MIVVDTSAVIAILREEPEAEIFAEVIGQAEACYLSAVGFLEASMVMIGRGRAELGNDLEDLLTEMGIELVPFDEQQARASREAFVRFGRGRHAAQLNFGDCISYALARTRALPLLYKGNDFARTDIISALPAPGPTC
ncbi:MAG: type II toxin-antitoxin system VapC family toxin [Thiohalocapsa sp.]